MVAAYLGHLAPSGKIVIVCAFQAADEMRRVQRLAYRMRQLQRDQPGFGARAKAQWLEAPAWQPLRQVVERLLVTYDWGEAFTALNLIVKPYVDHLFMVELARLARQADDEALRGMLYSLGEDCSWHRAWSHALVRLTVEDAASNRAAFGRWRAAWQPLVRQAIVSCAELMVSGDAGQPTGDHLLAMADGFVTEHWRTMGLEEGS